jgi:hypothetical protein
MATLAEIRAKLKQTERGSDNSQRSNLDNSIYPFWNLQEGKESVIRFLPDGDQNNTFFWVERAMIKLPFAGIKGEQESRNVTVQVPCVEMYNDGSVCPILSEVRPWYKDDSLKELASTYWKKRSYIFQGFVTEDGLGESDKPENPIRRLIIGPQVFNIIRSSIIDPEMDHLPTDYINGVDFRVKKGSKGGYADYATSNWSRRSRPLSDTEMDNVSNYKLFNLSDFLPKKPTDIELRVIKEMFEASVDGEAYDPERWGQYYKPAGLNQRTGDLAKPAISDDVEYDSYVAPVQPVAQSAPVVEAAPVQTQAPAGSDNRAADILAMIRSRNQAL